MQQSCTRRPRQLFLFCAQVGRGKEEEEEEEEEVEEGEEEKDQMRI